MPSSTTLVLMLVFVGAQYFASQLKARYHAVSLRPEMTATESASTTKIIVLAMNEERMI